jgi:alpha-tubulin suppressor-like RCC1 family protein
MSSNQNVTTNFRDSNGVDLGSKLVRKDYLISVYPEIGDKIGIPPELWTWGANFSGALGINATGLPDTRNTPVTTFAGGTNWKQLSTGYRITAAIKTDGTLWTWGFGSQGQLGNNQTTSRLTPVTTFAGGTDWRQVSCSERHVAAIKTNGTLWTWGWGAGGRLGNNATVNIITPVTTFAGGTNWRQVSAGNNSTSAIKADGTLWIWGNSEIGNGNLFPRSTPVTTFAGGSNWKQTSSGSVHTVAIKTDGTLWIWGFGSGRLGTNDTVAKSTPVTTFAGGNNWKQVSSGQNHTAAIKTDGTLWTWGDINSGQLGTNDTTQKLTPVTTFAGGTNWKQVNAGNARTTAIKTDGTLWVWGSGNAGRLGNNQTTNVSTPVTTFAGGTDWKQASSGNSHTAAIKSVDF